MNVAGGGRAEGRCESSKVISDNSILLRLTISIYCHSIIIICKRKGFDVSCGDF